MSDPAKGDPAQVDSGAVAADSDGDLSAWRQRWESGEPFAIDGGAGGIKGRLSAMLRRLARPLVRALWKRQTAFNLSIIDHLESADRGRKDLLRDLREVRSDLLRDVQNNHRRISHLEAFKRDGFGDVMRHSDALYAVLDQKLDRYRSESRELWSQLGALLARTEGGESAAGAALEVGWREQSYRRLEDRFRGTQAEIAARVDAFVPYLGHEGVVVDLGCGRGEALEVLAAVGFDVRGVDASAEMVAECRRRGLDAVQGDLLEFLAEVDETSLTGILSLHVIEHLDPEQVDRLIRLAWRALQPGGCLILETPNPASIVVAARNFWRDPTHRRPVHPDTLAFLLRDAGFESVERLDLRPFAEDDRLPEIDLQSVPTEVRPLAERVNAIRDQLDDLLYGYQDFALVGRRPALHSRG